MEQTQENKTAGKKEISYPKFIQERLDRIPWEELEASYGIRKDYILGNEQVARQLASGQVTDYVRCYAKVGNLTVIGPMALQANFRNDRVEVKHFTVNPNPDLSVYGDALRSDKVAERLMDTYEYTVKDDEGKAVRKETRHSFANGGSPITITRQNPDGSESKTRCLVSFDGFVRNRDGEIIRGTQKLFLTPCAEVQTYLEKVAPTMYGHEFTPEQRGSFRGEGPLHRGLQDEGREDLRRGRAVQRRTEAGRQGGHPVLEGDRAQTQRSFEERGS